LHLIPVCAAIFVISSGFFQCYPYDFDVDLRIHVIESYHVDHQGSAFGVVKLLVSMGKVDIESMDTYGGKPPSSAAKGVI